MSQYICCLRNQAEARMSPFAGIIQIKFNRMISERLEPNTGLHASGLVRGVP